MWERRLGFFIISGILALGCGDDGSATETEGTGSGGADTGTGAMTTASMTTASMTTAAMTDGADSSTGSPPDDTSGGTTMAPADSSGTAADTGTEGTAGSEGGSTTGGGGATYPQCDPKADPPCPEPDYDQCIQLMMGDFSFCSVACEEDGDCPEPSSGTAVAVCGGPNQDRCELDCSEDATCPDDMECIGVGPGGAIMRCAYPAN